MDEAGAQQKPQGGDAFERSTRERGLADFLVLAGTPGVVLGGLAALGEMSVWAAVFAALAIGAIGFAYLVATTGPGRDALRAAREAASLEAQAMRADSERQMRATMLEALSQPAMFIDAQGRVASANAAARRRFRIPPAGPTGGPPLAAVVRRPELLDAVEAARKASGPLEFEFVERDETDSYFACVAAPVAPMGGGVGVLVSMHDLTAMRRSELARVDFLANASHELRTPLASLSGFIETLRGPAREDAAAREKFLEIMQGQAERMQRLISDLLSLSRIELHEHARPETETDLAAVVAEVRDALAPVAREQGVELRIDGPAEGVMVVGVRDELTQVAQNLIDNAVKYSARGGVVEVEVRSGLPRAEAVLEAGRRWDGAGRMSLVSLVTSPPGAGPGAPGGGRFALLRVADAGPGIERQHLPRLSERFYRVDQGRGLKPGTGLGLAIVKHVVARHRGEFTVESDPGRGSAFGVVLPMGRG